MDKILGDKIHGIAEKFPALNQTVNGRRLVYLDSAATSMRPRAVLDAIDAFYARDAANPHRGLYDMAQRATEAYEGARAATAKFIGADTDETVFTRNATEALNIIAYSFAPLVLQNGGSIVIPILEHHSNLVPWQVAAKKYGATLRYLYIDRATGEIPDAELKKIDADTKIVAFAHVSNVLGNMLPVNKLVAAAKAVRAVTVLDAAQSIPHFGLDLRALDVDFAAFSGHKMYAPMGIGVLYGKKKLLDSMPPFLYGGDMIEDVREQDTDFLPPPSRFEAGTQNAGGAVGLAAAIEFIESIGYDAIATHEAALIRRLVAGLNALPDVTVIGSTDENEPRFGAVSFNINGVHPHDAATILNDYGVAIRAGKHCAHPLLKYLDVEFNACCRASLDVYSTNADVDALLDAIPAVRKQLKL
ncbi:MAG: SufS family cysteine desulfurase [Oscillospiraceae bacterium]|jgi:cysteine desulfurase/selenocysteine lyase|nr:SufS family cysteine desulfurase [Oscillospiraceae bacterium]